MRSADATDGDGLSSTATRPRPLRLPLQGRLPQWWMVTADGQIVDPTQNQFASKERGVMRIYWARTHGLVLDCGKLVFGDDKFCNEECLAEMTAYIEDSVKASRTADD